MNVNFDDDNFIASFHSEETLFAAAEETRRMDVAFEEDETFGVSLSQGDVFECEFGTGGVSGDYDGEYVVTPTRQTQTLLTAGKTLGHNVVVNPIPSNYGLITWDGSTLTVS